MKFVANIFIQLIHENNSFHIFIALYTYFYSLFWAGKNNTPSGNE